MKPEKLDAWVWVLVYGGLLALCVGSFLRDEDGALRLAFIAGGSLATLAGVLLVWLRSRIASPVPEQRPEKRSR